MNALIYLHQIMEITILSAQGLKNTSFTLFSNRLRPFVTITAHPPTTTTKHCSSSNCHLYKTRVDHQGGVNPTWGDKFHIPIPNPAEYTFFANSYSCIYLQLYTKTLIAGQTLLGWCQIPVDDIRFPPPLGSVRNLSYRLRSRDGSRTQGVITLSIKLDTCHAIGIPVNGICKGQL